ncbi:hypothetical protein [Reyranella sp.]|uniref:hypothetical protein n=1 Tax=Reyranella sp. TaxID=1929291 RepID=UPI003D0FE521
MTARAPAILVLLLRLVPALDGMIRDGRIGPDIREACLRVIAENRSAVHVEWDHLEQIIRQDQAVARAVPGGG